MQRKNTNCNKPDGSSLKPVRVELDDNREIEAIHHIVNERPQLLHLYVNERKGGIDLSIPLQNVFVIGRSPTGNRALETEELSDADTNVQQSEENDGLAADGGDI